MADIEISSPDFNKPEVTHTEDVSITIPEVTINPPPPAQKELELDTEPETVENKKDVEPETKLEVGSESQKVSPPLAQTETQKDVQPEREMDVDAAFQIPKMCKAGCVVNPGPDFTVEVIDVPVPEPGKVNLP